MWMNQPLPFHDNAMAAATAFQAAARQSQDKAWALHDKMYENARRSASRSIEKYAERGRPQRRQVQEGLGRPEDQGRGRAGLRRSAGAVGANGTPTFFINGREVVGAQPVDAFEKVIDDEIKKADELLKKGTPLKDVYKKRMEEAAPAAPAPAPRRRAPGARGETGRQAWATRRSRVRQSAQVTVVAFSDFQCPFCSRAVPALKQIEDDVQGQGPHRLQAAAAAVPRQGAAGGRGGAGRQRAGEVLGDARQAVRQPAGAGPPLAGEVRRRSWGSTWPSSRRRSTAASSRTRSTRRQGRRGGRRQRHADVLHQRHASWSARSPSPRSRRSSIRN